MPEAHKPLKMSSEKELRDCFIILLVSTLWAVLSRLYPRNIITLFKLLLSAALSVQSVFKRFQEAAIAIVTCRHPTSSLPAEVVLPSVAWQVAEPGYYSVQVEFGADLLAVT